MKIPSPTPAQAEQIYSDALDRFWMIRRKRHETAENSGSFAEFEEAVREAEPVVRAGFRPTFAAAVVSPVHLRETTLSLPNGLTLPIAARVTAGIRAGGTPLVVAYGLTTGLSSATLLAGLGNDYIAQQFAHLIAVDLVSACGRHLHRLLRHSFPEKAMLRIAVATGGAPAGRSAMHAAWNPHATAALLPLLPPGALKITATEAGALHPNYSVVGLAVGLPAPPP